MSARIVQLKTATDGAHRAALEARFRQRPFTVAGVIERLNREIRRSRDQWGIASWCRAYVAYLVVAEKLDLCAAEMALSKVSEEHWLAPWLPQSYFELAETLIGATTVPRSA